MAAVPASPLPEDVSLWDALPGMVLLLGADGTATHANAEFCAFLGVTYQAVLGPGWRACLGGDSCEALLVRLQRHEPFALELQVQRTPGQPSWVECSARWLTAGRQWVCLWHDRTEAKLAQNSAQAQAGLFRLLADNVPVLIAYYRAGDYMCQFANKEYARTFGRDDGVLIGRAATDGSAITAALIPHTAPGREVFFVQTRSGGLFAFSI